MTQISYIGIDIAENDTCHSVYDEFLVQSIEEPLTSKYGMIISITLLEHVRDNNAAIENMYNALISGNQTHHYIPSKYHPYSLALRIVGPRLQKKLIPLLRPAATDVTGYPTFFDHCSPQQMRKLFAKNGFVDIEIMPFYRANDYFAFFLPAYLLVTLFENFCALFGWSTFASGFVISGYKQR